MILLALAVASAVASTVLALSAVSAPRRRVRVALARAAEYGAAPQVEPERPRERTSFVDPIARLAQRVAPSATLDAVADRLAAAGVGRSLSPAAFLVAKLAAAVTGLALALLFAANGLGVLKGLVLAVLFPVFAFHVPDVLLKARARRRREEVLEALPNALDLLAVSVEAGLGLDAAVARLVDATKGPLSEELGLVLAELRAGAGRHDVLRRLAERVPAPETSSFVRAVIHADKLGTSLSETLRVQGREARVRRQAAAEEKAGKAPVRMLFPTVFFIFPALFVVVLGPAMIVLLKQL